MKTLQKIKTFLPVFVGFYNTIWEYNTENVLYCINQERIEKNLTPIEFYNLNINYKEYENDVAIQFCKSLENILNEFIEKIEFENIYNPKTYNFSNDSINCVIIPKIDNIKKFIYENKEKFTEYLKRNYTSCDGFLSHYSNDFYSWERDTKEFTDFSINGHFLGSILHFIYNLTIDDDLNIYYDVTDNIDEHNYIENINECFNTPICNKCKKFIENENILKTIEKYTNIMKKYPSLIYCDDCLTKG